MAKTTIFLPQWLADQVREKSGDIYGVHTSVVVNQALSLWARDLWTPMGDVEGPYSATLFVTLDDDVYLASLRKKDQTGAKTSPVIREALRKWVQDEWRIGLVKNEAG